MALDDLNAFVDRINDNNRDKTQALLNLQNAVGTDADAYAGSMRLSGYTQVPPAWSTPEIRADAERKAVADDPAVAAMPPVTALFFANPDHAAVAHDDVGTFTQIEDLARNGFGPRNNAPLGPRGSRSTLQFGTAQDRAEANYLAREYGTKPFQAIQGGLGKLATKLAFPVAGAVDAVNGDDYYREFASQLYDRFSRIQEDSVADPSQTFGGKVVRSVEELVPLVLSGGSGLAAIVGQATNDKYDDLTARGVDQDTALALAMKSGMTAYAMSKLPFGGRSLANSLVRGATLNPAFGALDRGLEKAGLNYVGYGKKADEINLLDPETMAHDLAMGLLFGAHHALQAGRPVAGDSLMESLVPFYDQYRAGRRAAALTGIGTIVRDSRVNNRAPELVQKYLSTVAAEHAGIDNAYVPVERWNELFRSNGLDPAHVAEETLSNPEAYREALATGSDIVIPFGEFTGKLSRLEQYEELVKDARLTPGDSTQREAFARVEAVKENAHKSGGFVDALKNMVARSQEAVKGNESYHRIYDDLVGQQAGIDTERSTAEHNAHLVANAFRVLGERAGVDPYELYSNYNLKLTRPLDTALTGDKRANEFWQMNYGTGEISSFGPVWRDLKHDAQSAVERLVKFKTGEVTAALHHPAVGDIDLVWGKEGTGKSDGYGLAKILKYHPEVTDKLQDVLSDMKLVSKSDNRVILESEKYKATVRLEWDGQAKQWLLTAFEKRTGDKTTTDTLAITGKDDTASLPTGSSLNSIINSKPSDVNTLSPSAFNHLLNQKNIADAKENISELYDLALGATNENRTMDIVPVPAWKVKAVAGVVALDGYRHQVDTYSIRHTLRQHGDRAREQKRGQLQITRDDILSIPETVLSPDSLAYGVKNSRGQDLIASVKRMPDGTLLVVEEVSTGRKTLSMASIRKYPAAKDSDSVARTLLSNARSDGGNPKIRIVHTRDNVKQPLWENAGLITSTDGDRSHLIPAANAALDQMLEHLRAGDIPKQSDDHLSLTRLKDHLDRSGIDLNSMDNQQVRDRLKGQQELWQSEEYQEKVRTVQSAIDEILNGSEEGTAHGLRPDLEQYGGSSDVSFLWGDEKKDIRHIGEKRGADVVWQVIQTVISGKVTKFVKGKKTVHIVDGNREAVLSLEEHGQQKTWLLTGWKIGEPDASGEVSTQSSATQARPMFSRSDLGAGSYKNIFHQSNTDVKRGFTSARPMDSELAGDKSAHEFWQANYGTDEASSFGPVWRDLKHDAQGAVERLVKYRTGEVIAALHHPDVGDIDLVWGKEGSPEKEYEDGFGFAKIKIKHPEVAGNLQNILDTTSVVSRGKNRIRLESNEHQAVVRLDWDGEGKQWLLTEFEKDKEPGTGKRTGASSINESDSPIHQALTDFIIDSKPFDVNTLSPSAFNHFAAEAFQVPSGRTDEFWQTKYGTAEVSRFGPVWRDLKHNAQRAVERLVKYRTGEVIAALHHSDVGDIDLIWGKEGTQEEHYEDGFGLAKILKKHPEVVGNMQEILDTLVKDTSKSRDSYTVLESIDHKAVVRLDWDRKNKVWLLTEFEKNKEIGTGKRAGASSIAESDSPILQSHTDTIFHQKSSDVNTLFQSVFSHLAADGVKDLYQPDRPVIIFRDGVHQIHLQASTTIEKDARIVSMLPRLDVDNLFDTQKITPEEAVRIGTEYYHNELEGHPVKSPAFNGEEVSFTDLGLAHLTGKHGRTLSTGNVAGRLKLLAKVREVLSTTPFVDEIRIEPDGKKYGLLGVFKDGTVVRVAVHQAEYDGKIFFSAYDWEDVGKKIKQLSPSQLLSSAEVIGVDGAPPTTDSIILNQDIKNVKVVAPDREEATASTTPVNNDYIKKVVTGVLHSAISRIKTPADAAHIAFPLTKRAQEAAIAIVTDAKGNVLGIIQHSTGALDSTAMSPRDLLGVLHDFPGAAEAWFAHNHPVGDPTPSPADIEVTALLGALLDGSGIKSRGMIVVGQAEGAVWIEGKEGRTEKIPLNSLHTDKERTQKITTYDREIIELPSLEGFATIEHAMDYAQLFGDGASGIIVIDANIRPVSFVPMSIAEMAKLKTGDPSSGSSAIMTAFHKGNGVAMIMVVPTLNGSRDAARNMISFGKMFGAPLMDIIQPQRRISFTKTDRVPKGTDNFFQSADAPVSHDFVRAPDGRYVFGEITPEIGAAIRRQSAPILLRNGNEREGKIHIERPERLKQIQGAGYGSAEEMVDSVVNECDAIYQGQKGNLLLAKKSGKNSVVYIQLTPSEHGDYYDVKTAAVVRENFFNNKKSLWERAQSNPPREGSPMRDLSGQSSLMENILRQNNRNVKRGYIRFDADRNFEIGLLKDADLSTFIHESGHFFTEVLGDLAERPEAPRQIKDDYAALLTFAGVDSRDRIRTEHHEKLAQAFEAYIMEGRAPSVETRSLFQRLKAWMIGVYKDLTALNVRLNPEIREVFDRMLATDAEMGRIRNMQEMKPLFATAGDAGMYPAEFYLYRKDAEQAGELAKEELLRTLMAEKSREQEPWWRDEQAALRDEQTAGTQAEPAYRALQEILKGKDFAGNATPGLKLNRTVLARMYGEEALKRLPKGSAADYLYTAQGGAHPELVAERYGFSSADEMIRAMLAAPTLGDFVAAKVDAGMKKRHGDLLLDGRLAGEAMKAAHNDQWAEVLRTEIGALFRKGGEDADAVAVPPVSDFRQAAQKQIAAKLVRAINPLLYLNGERKAAREALDLRGKGDFNGAAAARSRQLLNHFLYSEAAAALREVDAIRAEAGRMAAAAGSSTAGDVREEPRTATRPVELTGKELGDYGDDIKSLRKAAIEWYRKFLQGKKPAHRHDLGEIKFTQVGRKEIEHFGADPEKLKLVVALRDMIEKGDYVKEESPDHSRKDGIVKFHVIEVDVKLGDTPYRSRVLVGEDEFGNKFYDLFKDVFEHDNKKASKGTRASQSGGSLEGLQYSEGITTLNQSISPSSDGVNIQIVHEAGRMAADTRLETLGSMARPVREQMETLLSRFGLAEMSPGDQRTRQTSLQRFLDRMRRDEGIDLPVPAVVLNEHNGAASYRDLSMDELRAVSTTLRMIGHAAGVVNTVRKGEAGIALGEAEQQLIERLNASIPDGEPGDVADPTLSFLGRVRGRAPEIDIPIIRPEALFEHMDGTAASGPWHDLLWKPYNAAANHQNRVRELVFPAIFDLIQGKGIDRSHGKVFIERLHNSLTKDEIVAIALNCGNERNLDLLMRGGIRFPHDSRIHELSPETLQEALGHLSAGEIAVVNGVWKAITSLKPEMGALVRRQSGIEPVWIETSPIEVANGTLEGGYYPVVFDSRYSGVGHTISDDALPGRMFLRDGMRDAGAGSLSLDLESVVVRHLDRVVTLITHGEFASQAKRLLKNKGVKEAIVDRLGDPAHKNLLDWVAYTIEQDSLGHDSSRWLDNIRRELRARASVRIVGLKAADTVADIVTDARRAMKSLDVPHVVRGSFEYLRNPAAVYRFAVESSEQMRLLDHKINRTMIDARKSPAGKGTVLDDVQSWVVEGRAGVAKVAAMMVWISGYREAQAKGMDGVEAVRHADKASRTVLAIGRANDLSAAKHTAKARELAMLIGPALVRYNSQAFADRRSADQVVGGANPANGTTAFLFGIVAAGILQEALRNRQSETDDAFLPWFLARLARGLFTDTTPAGELTAHVEVNVAGETLDRTVFETGKATNETAQAALHITDGKDGPATTTAQYLHDLLTSDYEHNTSWNPATDILSYRRYQQ